MTIPGSTYEGRTKSGRSVSIALDPDRARYGWAVTIDNQLARHLSPPQIYRDGGTKVFHTDLGRVHLPPTARLGNDQEGTLDGEPLDSMPADLVDPPTHANPGYFLTIEQLVMFAREGWSETLPDDKQTRDDVVSAVEDILDFATADDPETSDPGSTVSE